MLTGKPIEKKPLGKPRRRWRTTLDWIIREIEVNTRNWSDSVQYGLFESPCEFDIDPPGSISHRVS